MPSSKRILPKERIRLALVVSGFPTADNPMRGIFNLRTARKLSEWVDLKVIFLRAWTPKRPLVSHCEYEGIAVTTVAVPQVPRCTALNVHLYRRLGWPLVRPLLNVDVMHSVDVGIGMMACDWARKAGVHHVTQAIGCDVNEMLGRVISRRSFARWTDNVHAVVCNSDALAARLLTHCPTARNVETVYRGVDLEAFQPEGLSIGPLTKRGPVRFLFMGGFLRGAEMWYGKNLKGGETLMSAWKAAESRLVETGASLLIAGPGANDKSVASWRAQLNSPEQVDLMGQLPPEDISSYIRSADAVLIPSLREGLPNLSMEAAACGRAVIASEVGGLPEVIIEQQTGALLPAENVEKWTEALCEHASQPARLKEMGRQARQRMQANFDSRSYAEGLLELYASALREPLSSNEPLMHTAASVRSTACRSM